MTTSGDHFGNLAPLPFFKAWRASEKESPELVYKLLGILFIGLVFKVGKAEVHCAEYFSSLGRSFRLFLDHRPEVHVDADGSPSPAEHHDDVLVLADGFQPLVYKITHGLISW